MISEQIGSDRNRACRVRDSSRVISNPYLPFVLLLWSALSIQAWAQQTPPTALQSYASLPESPQAQSHATNPSDQLSPASIHGVVVDRDGAVYQGVQISLTSTSATIPQTATSDSNGRFQFPNVPPGPFRLTASSQGFTTQLVTGILHPGESYEAPSIVLPFATTTTEVRVSASQEEVAEAQLKDEEKQRVFGVLPNFYVVYAQDAPPLTSRQKFHLAWRSSIDPVSFLATGFFSGIEQADGQFKGYGQGAQGYAKRYGANYADGFIGNMIGGAILPSLLKQDPRYFYKGTGTTKSRILYAIANSVMCKGDNGRWQVNYSGIVGGLAAGGISNLYYPEGDRNGAAITFENALTGIAGSAAQNLFQEFLVKHLTPKLPNYNPSKP